MKKALAIIIPIVLVLCVAAGVGIYFLWQSANKTVTDIQSQLDISPTIENTVDTTNNNVCSILTLDIAKQILGDDAQPASENSGNCTYSSVNVDTSAFGVLTMVVSKTNSITAKSNFEQGKTLAYDNQTEPVTGLNVDDAYYATTLKQLSILKGDSWIIISGTSDNYTDEKELAIATAKLIYK